MNTVIFPTLYKKAKTGKILQWDVRMEPESSDGCPVIIRRSGQMGGKIQEKHRMVRTGTNIGKANEETPLEHAKFLAQCMWNEKVEDNFVQDLACINDPPNYWYPMLAQTYTSIKKKLPLPAYAQPKLDGIRVWQPRHMDQMQLTVRDITPHTLLSREMHPRKALDHIKDELHIFGAFSPDGEIYKHGVPLQTINSWATDHQPGFTDQLEYWVYDLAIPNVGFDDRQKILQSLVPADHPIIKMVPTVFIQDEDEFIGHHDLWVNNGFEGAMRRSINGLYGFNDRPIDLLKYKNFKDDEFLVVGYEIEEYHDQKTGEIWNLVVWACEIPETGSTFTVRPVGAMESRRIETVKPDTMMNEKYNVRYQGKSIDHAPIFPTGRGFRKEL